MVLCNLPPPLRPPSVYRDRTQSVTRPPELRVVFDVDKCNISETRYTESTNIPSTPADLSKPARPFRDSLSMASSIPPSRSPTTPYRKAQRQSIEFLGVTRCSESPHVAGCSHPRVADAAWSVRLKRWSTDTFVEHTSQPNTTSTPTGRGRQVIGQPNGPVYRAGVVQKRRLVDAIENIHTQRWSTDSGVMGIDMMRELTTAPMIVISGRPFFINPATTLKKIQVHPSLRKAISMGSVVPTRVNRGHTPKPCTAVDKNCPTLVPDVGDVNLAVYDPNGPGELLAFRPVNPIWSV